MSVYDRLGELGIRLPAAAKPVAAFVMAAPGAGLVFVSGHIARKDGKVVAGKLGAELSTEDGCAAARDIAIDMMATLHEFLGDLDRVRRIVKVMCLVNVTPAYTDSHLVANGCSELLVEVFGERGRHARSAFGVAQIPLGSCVEIEMVVEAAAPA